ncbi:hypothetical protein YPPY101_2139, partial [Yersinia pestis PY-101]
MNINKSLSLNTPSLIKRFFKGSNRLS